MVSVVSDVATTYQTESLMMVDAASSVVPAVLLSAAASMDAVLMDVVTILSMTTARSVASIVAVSSLWSRKMLATSAILVVRLVSQALKVFKPTLLKDQDLKDSLAEEAFIMASVDSVMSVPTRTLAVSVVLVMSKPRKVLTSDMASKASTVLAVVMIVSVTALATSAAQLMVSNNITMFLALRATLSSTKVESMSKLVSPPVANQTNVSATLAPEKLFQ